jgi:hypothetical protein
MTSRRRESWTARERGHALSRGVALALTLGLLALCARDEAARAAPPAGHYVNQGNGTVLDTKTGLVWQRNLSASTYTWEEAKTYCTSLTLAGGGWRLPWVFELSNLVDEQRTSAPTIDLTAFPDTPSEWFWSASPYALSSGNAWYVGFHDGSAGYGVVSVSCRARCVR